MVDYIGTARLQELVSRIGTGAFIEQLAGEIEADYRRWREEADKQESERQDHMAAFVQNEYVSGVYEVIEEVDE